MLRRQQDAKSDGRHESKDRAARAGVLSGSGAIENNRKHRAPDALQDFLRPYGW